MANMGYCRFTNTAEDLEDCFEHFFDDDLSEIEDKARGRLVKLCEKILAENVNDTDPDICPACGSER